MWWFNRKRKLDKLGILGINSRNIDYIQSLNKRNLYPIVDNKIKTKKLL